MSKSSSKKKTSAEVPAVRQKTFAEKASSKTKEEQKKIREKQWRIRWISGAILAFLALLLFLSMIGKNAVVLNVFKIAACGLFGYGYWLIPPLFLFISWMLVFRGKEPAKIRTACISLFAFWIDCFMHCVFCKASFSSGLESVKELWTTGTALQSAGVISGAFARIMMTLISRPASIVLFLILICLFGVTAFKISVPLLIHKRAQKKRNKIKERNPEREMPEPDPEIDGFDTAADLQVLAMPIIPQPLLQWNAASSEPAATAEIPAPSESTNAPTVAAPKSCMPRRNSHDRDDDGLVGTWSALPKQPARDMPSEDQLSLDDITDITQYNQPKKQAPKKKKRSIEDSLFPMGDSYTAAVQKVVREAESKEEPEQTIPAVPNVSVQQDIPVLEPLPETEQPSTSPGTDIGLFDLEWQDEEDEKPEPENELQPITDVKLNSDENICDDGVQDSPITNPIMNSHLTDEDIEEGAKAAEKSGKVTQEEKDEAELEIEKEMLEQASNVSNYQFPPMTMLSEAMVNQEDNTREMEENVQKLEETLNSFNIDIKINNVVRGPTVTRYEMRLQPGVKMNKITSLHEDIALSLGVTSVRVAAVPGKSSVIGIEVPNKITTSVPIREVLSSREFENHKSKLAFTVGKSISGGYIIGDISKMPHLLIAGTTGSGKSVCMNSIIISLLYRAKPDEVKMIMIDPKIVELNVYNGIPHLLIPVVTDSKKAAGALQWAVTEMERRYRLMADYSVRDMTGYNKLAKNNQEMEYLPQIVIIIDELADLMMVAAKDVENSIVRIAQKARAAGMYLIIATQRPSADVITGLMKSNIPSRIAFAVSSAINSRIILDESGAEKLVGKGDMLYAPQGIGKPERVQGCFITDEEVEEIVRFIKDNSNTDATNEEYSAKIQKEIDANCSNSAVLSDDSGDSAVLDMDDTTDPLLPDAVEVVLDTKQASVSMLQRRLKLGYAHAARIVDEMEEKGIVGPFEGSKPRQLLITREKWETMVGINPNAKAQQSEPSEQTMADAENTEEAE